MWKTFRARARRAFTQGRYEAVIDTVREFNAYCNEHGWPDWWADMERLERDAIEARVRAEFE